MNRILNLIPTIFGLLITLVVPLVVYFGWEDFVKTGTAWLAIFGTMYWIPLGIGLTFWMGMKPTPPEEG